MHRRPSDRSQANDFPVAICKVFRPIVKPWMKQAGELFGFGIKAGKIRAFVEIAVMAGERKVSGESFPSCCRGMMCSM
jgi:hypothetical protein